MLVYFVLRLVLYSNSLLCQYIFTALSRTVPETERRLNGYSKIISVVGLGLMVFSANFKNNTAISWQSVGGDDNGTLNYIKLEVFDINKTNVK
jgi:hypothetical protein